VHEKVDQNVDVHSFEELMRDGDSPAQKLLVLVPALVSVGRFLAARERGRGCHVCEYRDDEFLSLGLQLGGVGWEWGWRSIPVR